MHGQDGGFNFEQCLITLNHVVNDHLIYLSCGASFKNCTIAHNAVEGTGFALIGWAGFANVTLTNSIFQQNAGALTHYVFGLPDMPFWISATNSNVQGGFVPLFVDEFVNVIDTNPQFVNPAQNVYRLKHTSPCIDHACPSAL